MKLKIYNTQNTINTISKPQITVGVTGIITFSVKLNARLKLEGKSVAFAEDIERPGDWFLILDAPEGFKTRVYKAYKNGTTVSINNKMIAEDLIKATQLEVQTSVKMPVSIEPIEQDIYAIITKGAVAQKPRKSAKVKEMEATNG